MGLKFAKIAAPIMKLKLYFTKKEKQYGEGTEMYGNTRLFCKVSRKKGFLIGAFTAPFIFAFIFRDLINRYNRGRINRSLYFFTSKGERR